ncbi:hypothetical protein OSB04_021422 [Centaurea solstitialis]|uniref:Galactose oxidase n=1 Tax=Centaurea solstitialis TaxID=347529 RepID=A0AA38SU58_9ASTR|nr:hypothetical protein OSB04_021422 [Centaurea solstitialis]
MASLFKTHILLLLLPQFLAICVFAARRDGGGGAPGPNQLVDDGGSFDYSRPEIETNFLGEWELDNPNVGVGAMQLQLMPNDQVVWYDATSVGPSARKLEPEGNCPINPDANNKPDCYAHALAYDWKTTKSRTIVTLDPPFFPFFFHHPFSAINSMDSHQTLPTSDPNKPLVVVNVHSVQKLTPTTYLTWKSQIEALLRGYDLFRFVDGSHPPPSKTVTKADKTEPNPAYTSWFRQDKLLFGALVGTLSPTLGPLVTRATTTKEAWDILANTYANPSRGHVKQLKAQLHNITKGSLSIEEFMHKIKRTVDELALLDTHISQEDVTDRDNNKRWINTKLSGEPWCSSGHLWPNGNFVATGGSFSGIKAIRMLPKDDLKANFIEKEDVLADNRWYASNQVLEDGSAIVVGGRDAYSYEIVPPQLDFEPKKIDLPFLKETRAPPKGPNNYIENNLYPFLFLLPDGNLFLFANNRAITFTPTTGEIVQEYPICPGGSRNYPPSGSSAILPLKLGPDNSQPLNVEIVICGGNRPNAFELVEGKHATEKEFLSALSDCHRIHPMEKGATWEEEQDMPSPRIMADLLHLPTGDLLMINGAKRGTSGWEDATDPNFTPLLYTPFKPMGNRFKELKPAKIARMYHSTSALLPDTKILVAGSNPHKFYTFNVEFPTELRVEKFSPHYLDPKLEDQRPIIDKEGSDKVLKYGKPFKIAASLQSEAPLVLGEIKVTMLYPPFTTHGYSQNQRLIVPLVTDIANNVITAVAPPSGKIAPPGYYILFVNNLGVPGDGIWVHID